MNTLFLTQKLLFAMPGGTELLLVLAVILLFFGGKKIPELMGGIGRGAKEYREGKEPSNKEIDNKLSKSSKFR